MRRASNRNVMAWTFMGNTRMHQVLREKGNKLSHVGIFTFEVSADGTISETGTAVSTILPYVKKWPHIKWLLTIMNHGTASIFTALRENTNGAQDTFLSEIVRIIDKYPWCSGIDIDLERGGELANRTKANALFSRIYSTVKAKGANLHVNICLPGMTSVGGSVGGENWCVYADLDAYCDTAAIMSYGMSWAGSAPGPVSPRSWLEGIYNYAANAMNPDKIMMGLPGYGWRWQIYDTTENLGTTYRGTSLTYYAAKYWMSENNKWSIRKKFERGEVMITTSRFLGYDKNEYGDLIVNRKEAEIVSLTFDLYLMNVGSSRIGELLDYLGVKTVTGTTWESGTINGMLCNEKYKGDFHLQKYYTPENKRNHTRKNNGEVQSYYISENHEPIVSPEVWEKVQEVREQRKRDRNIGQDSTMKFQNRYPLSGMLICPYCGKTLRRRQVYKKKIQWLCSTYIEKGVKACKGIRIDDVELQGLNITEQTVIEEVVKNGKKHYCYTSKADFDCGIRNSTVSAEIEDGSVLPSVNRPRRTVIKL